MRCISLPKLSLATAVSAILCACGGNGVLASSPGLPGARALQSKIQHVVIIVQENLTFNNLFYGYPGAKTATYGYDSAGKKVKLKPVTIATAWDLQHNARGYMVSCNGTGYILGHGLPDERLR